MSAAAASVITYFIYYNLRYVNYVNVISITYDKRWFTLLLRSIGSIFCLYGPASYFEKTEYIRIFNTPVSQFTIMIISTLLFIMTMSIICRKRND